MSLTTVVPLNTMIADLDETIRQLLKRELATHGFDNVEIVFDAPNREWSGQLSGPTVNLFLYDVRESQGFRPTDMRENGRAMRRPPLRVECSFAVTAWTQDVQDEHRLLSQILAILFAYPVLEGDVLTGDLHNQHYPISTKVGQTRAEGKADFWSAVGGQFKASLDYVVSLTCEGGVTLTRGPEVRTITTHVGQTTGTRTVLELHGVGGRVLDTDGEPVHNAWVTLPDSGQWTSTDDQGRYRFERVQPGTHRCVARAVDGTEAEAELTVPGKPPDLTLEPKAGKKKPRGSA